MKDMLKTHLLTILCAISLVALFLPFATCSVSVEIMGSSSDGSQSMSGFAVMQEQIIGFALAIGPILLIAMNYVKQLEQYKGLLAVAVPVACVIVCIVLLTQIKSIAVNAMGGGGFGVDVKTSVGIGCILALLSYVGTAIAGAITYHNFSLDKAGLEKFKQDGTQLLQTAQQKLSDTTQSVTGAVQNVSSSIEATASKVGAEASAAKPTPKKSVNLNRTDEVLAMIEKLAQMKDAGILTEEEFSEKKKQLLSEI